MDLDEGLVCGACYRQLDRLCLEPCGCADYDGEWTPVCCCVMEPEVKLAKRALAAAWQRVVGGHGEHWFCPKHTLAVRAADAVVPTTERLLVRGLVAVVEVVE